jgi:hypothetical protein
MPQSDEETAALRQGPGIDRIIYTTIAMLSVLIVYDGWDALTFWGVAAVMLGPVLAMFLSHVYATGLALRVRAGRTLTWEERRSVVQAEAWILLLLVPPFALLTVLNMADVGYTHIVQAIVWTGVVSLGVWCAVAGRRADLRGWALVASVAFGLLLGALILLLQTVLQPGQATLRL